MALIQVNVDEDVKRRADKAFARNGITTPMAMRMMITQVANEGRTPFDGVFSGSVATSLAEDVRRDMIFVEAQEYGLISDDTYVGTDISDAMLAELGLTAEEVGQ